MKDRFLAVAFHNQMQRGKHFPARVGSAENSQIFRTEFTEGTEEEEDVLGSIFWLRALCANNFRMRQGCARMLAMSSAAEIEEAIAQLPEAERDALESRLFTQRFGLDNWPDHERRDLLASLDEADNEMNGGIAYSASELQQAVREWSGG